MWICESIHQLEVFRRVGKKNSNTLMNSYQFLSWWVKVGIVFFFLCALRCGGWRNLMTWQYLCWCACQTPEVTDSYRATVRCDLYASPERIIQWEVGRGVMPLFMMKHWIMETRCVISFSAPFITISPAGFREKLTGGHPPPSHTPMAYFNSLLV